MTAETDSSDRVSTKILRGPRPPQEMHLASSILGAFKHVSVGLIDYTIAYDLNLPQVEWRLQTICERRPITPVSPYVYDWRT